MFTILARLKGNKLSVFGAADEDNAFDFDMEARHTAFWTFVRNKDWDAVGEFFDKQVSLESGRVDYSY